MTGRIDVRGLRGFYAIVDPDACRGRDPVVVARAVLAGGCAAMQLRAKRLAAPAREALGVALRALCADAGVPFYVNDMPHLAQRIDASGVHLGQDDLPLSEARAIIGEAATVGVSTHDLAQALAAVRDGADLIGFGPVFATRSKLNPDPVVGLDALATVCRQVHVPVVAIGGIDADSAHAVATAGAPLAAAIGAVCGADDPTTAAAAIHRALRRDRQTNSA